MSFRQKTPLHKYTGNALFLAYLYSVTHVFRYQIRLLRNDFPVRKSLEKALSDEKKTRL